MKNDPYNIASIGIIWEERVGEPRQVEQAVLIKAEPKIPVKWKYKTGHSAVISSGAINDALRRLYGAILEQNTPALVELARLRNELAALQTRVDKLESQLATEEKADEELAKEIVAIGASPVDLDSVKPEDWLPTGEELDRLFEED